MKKLYTYAPEPEWLEASRKAERAAHEAYVLAYIVPHYDDARRGQMTVEEALAMPARFRAKERA